MTLRLLPALLIAVVLCAGDQPQRDGTSRPKIGLALSGGAALGLAHVGVLQWFEAHRIPIDYIAGTSMGGLVAGIHASGLNSAETIELVRKIDWRLALAAGTPYPDLSFRRKEDAAQYPVALELGLKKRKLTLPSGLSPGQGVALVLDRFAAPYGDMDSFDDLPTPFRCVASDLASGKGIVLDKGSLFEALRATMSLPAMFAPVRRDGMVLVDGGLTNNLPVDVVRSMGADIVIAVALDVPTDPKDFASLLGIAGRSISYMIMANERPSIAAADIVIMPMLKGMLSSDYVKWEKFRDIGYVASEQKAKLLERYQLSEDDYETYLKSRASRRRSTAIRPERIEVEGDVAPRLKAAVISALTPEEGKQLDPRVLEEQMLKLTGAGRFELATYEFRRNGTQETLVVKVQEKPHGPPLLKPAILIDGASGEGLRFGAGGRFTFLDLGGPASEWRTDLSIGTFNLLQTEYYYRIRGGKWFVAPIGSFSQDQIQLYNPSGDRIAEFNERDLSAGADLGYAFGRARELRMGYHTGHLRTYLTTGTAATDEIAGRYGVTSVLFRLDRRDSPLVPLRGSSLSLRASWYDRYPTVVRQFAAFEGQISNATRLTPRYVLWTRVAGGGTADELGLSAMFRLGGIFSMSGLSRQQLLGSRMYYANASLLRSLSGSIYALLGYEAGQAWSPGRTAKPRQDGLFGFITATPVGVLFIGGSIADQGDRKVLFRVGRSF